MKKVFLLRHCISDCLVNAVPIIIFLFFYSIKKKIDVLPLLVGKCAAWGLKALGPMLRILTITTVFGASEVLFPF